MTAPEDAEFVARLKEYGEAQVRLLLANGGLPPAYHLSDLPRYRQRAAAQRLSGCAAARLATGGTLFCRHCRRGRQMGRPDLCFWGFVIDSGTNGDALS